MTALSIIIIVLICLIVGSTLFLAVYCFNDDEDQFWYDEFAVSKCPHHNQSKVTVDSTVTCETIHTICDDCGEVLNIAVEC